MEERTTPQSDCPQTSVHMHTSTSDRASSFWFSKNKTFSKDEISEVEYAVIQHMGSGRQEDHRVRVVVDYL